MPFRAAAAVLHWHASIAIKTICRQQAAARSYEKSRDQPCESQSDGNGAAVKVHMHI